jgi:glucan phosphoethanolaminetransferase (alkaline phosphatase superfamily)
MPDKRNIVYPLALFLSISLIRSLKLKNVLIIIVMTFSAVHLFHIQYFGNLIQPVAFMQFFQNTGEVFDSLYPELPYMIAPLVLSVLTTWALVIINRKFQDRTFTFRFSPVVFFGALVVHALIIAYHLNSGLEKLPEKTARFIYPRPNRHSFENYMRSVNCFLTGVVPKLISRTADDFPELPAPLVATANPDRNIILVIGESLRSDRMSLFGYDKPTTPLLDSIAITEPFTHKVVLAGGTMTRTVFAVLLNRLKYPGVGRQLVGFTNNLFKLARENGFTTHFISKHSYSQLEIVDNLLSKQSIDNYIPSGEIAQILGEKTYFDGDLLKMLARIDLNKPNFIILHQRGSHSSSVKLYPEEFQKFEGYYDNSVLYTDYVISGIYDYLKSNSPKETYLIFTSDHGEMLGEVKGKKGHGWFEKEVYNVPYLYFAINTTDSANNGQDMIRCHFDVSTLVQKLLGYDSEVETDDERTIYLNGSEMNALGGYMVFKLNKDSVLSNEIIR